MTREGSVNMVLPVDADAVFGHLTDIDRLPDWNALITQVVERPAIVTHGAQWVVELSAMGHTWRSRSAVVEHNPAARVFRYRSQTDDGNSSYGDWSWHVLSTAGGCEVTVSWQLHPRSFWRRALLARLRNWQLIREVSASLAALGALASRSPRDRQTLSTG